MQMRGKRIATMQRSKNKNHTFVTQKPPFCTTKTILLHVKNHTFVMRICNIQKTNTLQTFRECVANTPKWVAKHSAIYPRTPTKLVANTPPGVGVDSSRPYPNITQNAYSHNQICISLPHFVGVYVYAGTINRPLQLLTDCDNTADGLPITWRTFCKTLNVHHEIGCEHSARRRGRFIAPVS